MSQWLKIVVFHSHGDHLTEYSVEDVADVVVFQMIQLLKRVPFIRLKTETKERKSDGYILVILVLVVESLLINRSVRMHSSISALLFPKM